MIFTGSDHLSDVYCYSENVPETDGYCFGDFHGNMMPYSNDNMVNATLHVPELSIEHYSSQSPRSLFGSIVALQKYTLQYKAGNEVMASLNYYEGEPVDIGSRPQKDGYTYQCPEAPAYMPHEDVTINGSLVAKKYHLTYIVDGEIYKVMEMSYCDMITPEPTPMREGFSFSGWDGLPMTMPAYDVTATGFFKANQYTITYVIDGETYKKMVVDFGSTIIPPGSESDEYRFVWGSHPTTMPAYDITVNGSRFATGIRVISNGKDEVRMYTVDGRRQENPMKGLVIARYSKGCSKKILVK